MTSDTAKHRKVCGISSLCTDSLLNLTHASQDGAKLLSNLLASDPITRQVDAESNKIRPIRGPSGVYACSMHARPSATHMAIS